MESILQFLRDNSIYLNRDPPNITIEKTGSGNIQVFFLGKKPEDENEIKTFIQDLANANNISHATVKILEDLSIEAIEMAFNVSSSYVPAVIIATKADIAHTKDHYENLINDFGPNSTHGFTILPVALIFNDKGEQIMKGLVNFDEIILQKLDLIRVYTKSKKGVSDKPLIVQKSSNVGDVALKIHKDLYSTFEFAYVFRNLYENEEKTRIKAGIHFSVLENDIIEIFSRI
jgi:ribosome-interacting GTPase 1